MLIKVKLNLSQAPFVSGLYGIVLSFLTLLPQPTTYGNAPEGGNVLIIFTVTLSLMTPEAPFLGMFSSHNLGTPTKFTSNLAVYSMLQLEQYTDQT